MINQDITSIIIIKIVLNKSCLPIQNYLTSDSVVLKPIELLFCKYQ